MTETPIEKYIRRVMEAMFNFEKEIRSEMIKEVKTKKQKPNKV